MSKIQYVDELPSLPLESTRVCLRHENGTWLCGQWTGVRAIGDADHFLQGYLLEGREHGFVDEFLIEATGFKQSWAIAARKKVATAIRALSRAVSTACVN
jgi:hypothetical protein